MVQVEILHSDSLDLRISIAYPPHEDIAWKKTTYLSNIFLWLAFLDLKECRSINPPVVDAPLLTQQRDGPRQLRRPAKKASPMRRSPNPSSDAI